MKHTKGPWRIEKSSVRGETIMPIDLCVNDISIPDAALIAAAPEILEALEFDVLGLMEEQIKPLYKDDSVMAIELDSVMSHLKNVIKKAKGE